MKIILNAWWHHMTVTCPRVGCGAKLLLERGDQVKAFTAGGIVVTCKVCQSEIQIGKPPERAKFTPRPPRYTVETPAKA